MKLVTNNNKNVSVVFTTHKIIRYCSNKSKTPKELEANLVYQFTCHGCEALYVGETKRHLKTRLAEHRQQSRSSHIKNHNNSCNKRHYCNCDISEFKVLGKQFSSTKQRKVLESIIIKEVAPSINKQLDFRETLYIFGLALAVFINLLILFISFIPLFF